MNNAAIANDIHASTVTTEAGSVTYRNIKDRDCKRFGRVVAGRAAIGQHARLVPGRSVTLWGVDRNCSSKFRPYRVEFKIGDSAVYDSFNLTYTGTIVAIGEKTITIEKHGTKHRLSVHEFNWRNNDFDAQAIADSNHETMMCL